MSSLITSHHHKRKLREKGIDPLHTKLQRFIDTIIYPIGIASLLMALPQAYEVWIHKNVVGVSLLTWGLWTVFSMFWALYGYVHKNRLIFYLQIGWFIVQGFITIGIIVHS